MSLAAISKHIHILAAAGLVRQEKAGRVVTCRILPDGLRAAGIWLQGVGGFDAEDYDALERLVSRGARRIAAGRRTSGGRCRHLERAVRAGFLCLRCGCGRIATCSPG